MKDLKKPQDINDWNDEDLENFLEETERNGDDRRVIGWMLIAGVVVFFILLFLFSVDKKVDTPEYQQNVEFEQLLESIKDTPFTITIDGKKHIVTVGEIE